MAKKYILGVSYYRNHVNSGHYRRLALEERRLLETIARAYEGTVNVTDPLEPKITFSDMRKLREGRNELVASYSRGHLHYHSIHPVRPARNNNGSAA